MVVKEHVIETQVSVHDVAAERKMGILIGRTLRIGVLTSAAFIIFGLLLYFITDDGPQTVDEVLAKGHEITQISLSTIIDGVEDASPEAFIQVGILVLILTPIVRVAMTLGLFARQRDWTFVALAGFVLVVLLLGLIGIGA
jgi:uncharacterized membrane protein